MHQGHFNSPKRKVIFVMFMLVISSASLFISCNDSNKSVTETNVNDTVAINKNDNAEDTGAARQKSTAQLSRITGKKIIFENCQLPAAKILELQQLRCTGLVLQFSVDEINDTMMKIIIIGYGKLPTGSDLPYTPAFLLEENPMTLVSPDYLLMCNYVITADGISRLLMNGSTTADPGLKHFLLTPTTLADRTWKFNCKAYFTGPTPDLPREGRVADVYADPSPPAPSPELLQKLYDSYLSK